MKPIYEGRRGGSGRSAQFCTELVRRGRFELWAQWAFCSHSVRKARKAGTSLDPVMQIRLFGKLKLMNCADFTRVGSHAGFLFDQSGAIRNRAPRV